MKHCDEPWAELRDAEGALERMKAATHDEASRLKAWSGFLEAINRVWDKAKDCFRDDGRWSNWHHPYLDARKNDELLAYLEKACDRREHSVKPFAWTMPPYSQAERSDGEVFTLADVDFGADGRPRFKVPVDVQHHAAEVVNVPIEWRGRAYPPPKSHMGVPLPAGDIALAEAGLEYYRAFLTAAEAKFVDGK